MEPPRGPSCGTGRDLFNWHTLGVRTPSRNGLVVSRSVPAVPSGKLSCSSACPCHAVHAGFDCRGPSGVGSVGQLAVLLHCPAGDVRVQPWEACGGWRCTGGGVDLVGFGCKMEVPKLALQPGPPCAEHQDRQVTCLWSERSVRRLGSVMGLEWKEDQALCLLLGIILVLCRLSNTSCIPVPLPWLAVCCLVLVRQPGCSLTRSRTRNEKAGQEMTLLSSFAAWLKGVETAQTTAGSHCKAPLMLSCSCSPQATSPLGKKPLLSPKLLTLPVTCVLNCHCSAGMVP